MAQLANNDFIGMSQEFPDQSSPVIVELFAVKCSIHKAARPDLGWPAHQKLQPTQQTCGRAKRRPDVFLWAKVGMKCAVSWASFN